jgi:hypothetical protein
MASSQSGSSEKVAALLGGSPGPEWDNKPMSLEQELKAEAKYRHERWAETSRLNRAILAPLHKIIVDDEEALAAATALSKKKGRSPPTQHKTSVPRIESPIRGGSILTFHVPPYNSELSPSSGSDSNLGPGPLDADYGGATANKSNGTFTVSNDVHTDSFSAWGASGVGVWFQPVTDNTYVRVAPASRGTCYWDNNSWGFAAHNNALIRVLVESFDLTGQDRQVEVDRKIQQWSDGTGQWEEHGYNSIFTVWFPADTYFMANTYRRYRIWSLAEAWCDAEGSGLFGSSADSSMKFETYMFVFEQWT